MEFLQLSEARYSLRKFSDRPVEAEKLAAILEAGRNAPTAHNLQPEPRGSGKGGCLHRRPFPSSRHPGGGL